MTTAVIMTNKAKNPVRAPVEKNPSTVDGSTRPTTDSKSIPIEPPPSIPRLVVDVCDKLAHAGFRGWLAGGCVRDMIMKRQAHDWDVVTDAPLETIRALFPNHLEVGAAFGVIKFPPAKEEKDPPQIDLAIFRKEEGYSDLRHPDKVEVGDEQTDSARRDFTVNALYYDPRSRRVIDWVGGHKDIASRVLRTVGDPSQRFSEDALRILRAVRFSAQLGFKLERETAAALKRHAHLLAAISRERVREELYKLLRTAKPISGLEAMAQNGLWEQVFGVRKVSLPADFRQLKLPWSPTPLQWLCGLGVTGLLGDPQREREAMMERLTELLRLTNAEKRTLSLVLRVYEESDPKLQIGAAHSDAGAWVELACADKPMIDMIRAFVRRARGPSEDQKNQVLAFLDQILRWSLKPGSQKNWPGAKELMAEGLKSGPKLGLAVKKAQWQAFWKTRPA